MFRYTLITVALAGCFAVSRPGLAESLAATASGHALVAPPAQPAGEQRPPLAPAGSPSPDQAAPAGSGRGWNIILVGFGCG
jgi:hypothetical protein